MISSIVVSSIEDTLVLDFSKPLIYDSVSAGNLITIKVFLSDPPCKDGITRFTTVPLKPLAEFDILENVNFHLRFLCESDLHIPSMEKLTEINTYQVSQTTVSSTLQSD